MEDSAAVCNGQADGDHDAKKDVVDEQKDEEKKEKNPGKALLEYLEKTRSPLCAVYMKRKEYLLEILEAENYRQVKAHREKEREQLSNTKTAEKLETEIHEKCKEDVKFIKDSVDENESYSRSCDSSAENSDNEEEQKEVEKENVPYAAEMISLNQAMMVAITTSQPEMLEILLQAGANPDAFDKWYPIIHTVVDMKNVELFDIVKKYVSDITVESYYGNLLHASARAGSLDILKVVYDNMGLTKMTGCKANGSTPLHDAVRAVPVVYDDCEDNGNEKKNDILKDSKVKTGHSLEEEKTSENDVSNSDKENVSKESDIRGSTETELCKGARKPKFDFTIIEFLLEKGCSVNVTDSKLKTPLHEAAIIGNTSLVDVLLKAGAEKMALDSEQNTPWLYAAIYGHTHLFEILFDTDAIDEPFDDNNNCYIHKVAKLDKLEALKFLLNKGANQLVTNNNDETPLELAVTHVNAECVKELLNQPDPGLHSVNSSKPFREAFRQFPTYKKDVLELFLAKEQNINVMCDNKTLLLHYIGYPDVLEWLLIHGADPDFVTPSGEYALMAACNNVYNDENDRSLRLLLYHNADVTKTALVNNEGLTPLQIVIHESNYHHTQLCLLAGFSLCGIHDWLQMNEERVNQIIGEEPLFQDLFDYMKMTEYGPISLKGLSRLRVLKCLGSVDVESSIKELGLPTILEDFLNWEKYLKLRSEEYDRYVEQLKKSKK